MKQNLLNLKVDNLYTSASITRTETVIEQLVNNVPNNEYNQKDYLYKSNILDIKTLKRMTPILFYMKLDTL